MMFLVSKPHATAAHWIHIIEVIIGVSCLTKPTPLVFAKEASHMIATFALYYLGFAHWTKT